MTLTVFLIASLAKIAFVLAMTVGLSVPAMIWVERKVAAWTQDRMGPNRVGPFGIFQPLADGIKIAFKEDSVPTAVHRVLFFVAPVVAMIPAFMTFAVIPFGGETTLGGILQEPIRLQISSLNVGIVYVLAISSLAVYAILLAAWASNNTFSLLGGLRASAQMISYEVALGLSIVPIILLAGGVDLNTIVSAQSGMWFIVPGILSFFIFVPAVFAETNRLPFDLPETEAELVAGFHTEFSSMRFAAFFLAEYCNMITASALIVTLFLGGWELLPYLTWAEAGIDIDRLFFLPVLWFGLKLGFFMFLYVWIRWTLPRFRYDQLMALGWGRLIPLSILNIIVVSLAVFVKDSGLFR